MQPPTERRPMAVRIALGSNLGRPREAVQRGWDAAIEMLGLRQPRLSTIIASAPAEGAAGGTFANAVGVGYTALDPHAGLALLQRIERAFGRDRLREGFHGARPLDLDVLDWGGMRIDAPNLQLPHPRSHERWFVLEPWAELEPHHVCPCCGSTIASLARAHGSRTEAATDHAESAAGSVAP